MTIRKDPHDRPMVVLFFSQIHHLSQVEFPFQFLSLSTWGIVIQWMFKVSCSIKGSVCYYQNINFLKMSLQNTLGICTYKWELEGVHTSTCESRWTHLLNLVVRYLCIFENNGWFKIHPCNMEYKFLNLIGLGTSLYS